MTTGMRSLSLTQTFALVFFSMLVVMMVFELVKQVLAPGITVWESHVVTILFTSVVAVVVVFFPLRYAFYEREKARVAGEALKKSEEMFRGVAERSFDLIMLTDSQGKVIYVAPSVRGILGFEPREMMGKGPEDFIDPGDLEKLTLRLPGSSGETVVNRFGVHIRKKDGDYAIVEFSGTPIIKDGIITGFQVIGRDVTDRTRAEEELRNSRQILEGILNAIPVRVFWKDKNLVFLGCNTAFARDAGFEKPEDVVGKDDYEMSWREQADRYRADDLEVIRSGKPKIAIEEPQTTPSGETAYLLTSKTPLINANGEIIGVLGTYLDITDRKRTEVALRESEKKFRDIFNNTFDAINILAVQEDGMPGGFIDVNEAGERMLGYSRQELLNMNLDDIQTHAASKPWDIIEKELQTQGYTTFETEHIRKDGTTIPVEVSTHTVELQGKAVFIAVIRDITERKKAEEALFASERRSAKLLEALPDMMFVISYKGEYRDFSIADTSGLMIPPDKIIGTNVRDSGFGKETTEIILRNVNLALEMKTLQRFEYSLALPQGRRVYEARMVALTDDEALAIVRDITNIKQAEAEIRESEEKFRTIFEHSNDAILFAEVPEPGALGSIVDANEVALRKLGYSKGEFVPGPTKRIVSPDLARKLPAVISELLAEGHITIESELTRKDGALLPVEISARVLTIRDRSFIVGIARDITERQRTEKALKASEKRYRTLFEESPIPLWEEDLTLVKAWMVGKEKEGISDFSEYLRNYPEDVARCARMAKVIHINRATMALFGAGSLQEFQEGISAIFSSESHDAFGDEISALCTGQKEFESEVPLRTLPGERKIVIMKVTVVPGYEKTLSRILVSVIDITRRKNVEEALQHANKKLNMLSSITRHDILNLIMAIRGYLELSLDLAHDTELRKYMEREDEAVNAIQRQIEFTRYYQDIGVEEPKWQEVAEIIARVAGQLDLGGIVLDNPLSGLEVFADPLIEKVFYNLIENSLRHGEHVTSIGFSAEKADSGLVISYRDNGIGISEQDKKKLFQRGFGKHTGLGLFLSREILSITDITIRETGEPGKGVNFEIFVPEERYRYKE